MPSTLRPSPDVIVGFSFNKRVPKVDAWGWENVCVYPMIGRQDLPLHTFEWLGHAPVWVICAALEPKARGVVCHACDRLTDSDRASCDVQRLKQMTSRTLRIL